MNGPRMQLAIRRWWQARSARERRFLVIWGAAALILVLWFGVLSPLSARIARLQQGIPVLEAQLNRMRAPAAGNSPASARPSGRAGEDLGGALKRLLADQQVGAELRPLSGQRVEMRLPDLPAKTAFNLLDGLRRASEARVVSLVVEAGTAVPATVRLVAELERLP